MIMNATVAKVFKRRRGNKPEKTTLVGSAETVEAIKDDREGGA